MGERVTLPTHIARRFRRGLGICVAVIVVTASGCSSSEPDADGGEAPPSQAVSPIQEDKVVGPLCGELPSGDDPGAPSLLADMPANEALKWMPVLTIFEAAARATGLDAELRKADGITILAPTDDTFGDAFSENTLDRLLLFRQDELRAVLDSHVIEEELSLHELRAAGTVTPVSGASFEVEPSAGEMVRIDGRARTVCADYRVANASIHLIDRVLGKLPKPAPEGEPAVG